MPDRTALLDSLLKRRILILDGAMGTMIQGYRLSEADYRGSRFRDHSHDLKGNNDLLTLTQPQIIREIHDQYLAAGADVIETNTFNSTSIAQTDYHLQPVVYELNREAARLARAAADACAARDPQRPRFVAGALGPTNRTASISPDVNDPGFRNTSFDELRAAYAEAGRGLAHIIVGLAVGARGVVRAAQAEVGRVPLDDEGLDPQALEDTLRALTAAGKTLKLLYTVPS